MKLHEEHEQNLKNFNIPFENMPNFLKPQVDFFSDDNDVYEEIYSPTKVNKKGDLVRPDLLIKMIREQYNTKGKQENDTSLKSLDWINKAINLEENLKHCKNFFTGNLNEYQDELIEEEVTLALQKKGTSDKKQT